MDGVELSLSNEYDYLTSYIELKDKTSAPIIIFGVNKAEKESIVDLLVKNKKN